MIRRFLTWAQIFQTSLWIQFETTQCKNSLWLTYFWILYFICHDYIFFLYHRSQQPVLDTTLSSSTSKSSVKDPKANVIKEEPEAEKKEETTTDVVANGAPEGKIFFICWRKSNNSHMHDVGWTSTLITIGFGSFLFCFNLVLHTLNTLVSFI